MIANDLWTFRPFASSPPGRFASVVLGF